LSQPVPRPVPRADNGSALADNGSALLQLSVLEQAATADAVNDTKNKTASRAPTVFLSICFPIYIHSPNF